MNNFTSSYQLNDKCNLLVQQAIQTFNENERFLIENDLSERCICAKFATYLKSEIENSEFSDYEVDVEYNRGYLGMEYKPKGLDGKNITVDLIVHKRSYNPDEGGFHNLICIEMKKHHLKEGIALDRERIKKLTNPAHGYCYKAGYIILIVRSKRRNNYCLEIEAPVEYLIS